MIKRLLRSPVFLCAVTYLGLLLLWAIIVAWHFPYDVGGPKQSSDSTKFYDSAYSPEDEQKYVQIAETAAKAADISGHIKQFVRDYHLEGKRVLDVGAGRGYLQDVVQDYTGLDISQSAARNFHKPFVLGSATKMPFKNGEFDVVWSIWVLEHIPNPELALEEMRRVVKPSGFLYLKPAWLCSPWAADGYHVRPYGAFGVRGKVIKAALPVVEYPLFQVAYGLPISWLRSFAPWPTRLHYRALVPNYQHYWEADSDAVNSIDPDEVRLWFTSRGDHCTWVPGINAIVVTKRI